MTYVETHPRTTRGKSVHHTQEERKKQQTVERKKSAVRERDIEKTYKLEETQIVEAKFLTPESKNFVLTDAVKKYEDRALLWIKAGYPVHIIGPTGCGKTALAIHIAEKLGKPAVWINGDEQLTTHELIGGYSRIEMKSLRDKYIHNVYKSEDIIEPQWVNNPLALACQKGYTLIYNEFSRSKPEANNILLSILEEGILELPTKFGEDRYIKVHPDFNLILTSNNTEYAGVHQPQDALLDRICAIYMDYYDEATEVAIVKAHAKIADADAKKIVGVVRHLRETLKGTEAPGTRPAIMLAHAIRVTNGMSTDLFEQLCFDAIASKTKDSVDLEQKGALIKTAIDKLNLHKW
ncbi:MAG: gas vesicle protein GvpN [Candidatus Diapherotrites archaeon]